MCTYIKNNSSVVTGVGLLILFLFIVYALVKSANGEDIYIHGGLHGLGLDSEVSKEELNYTCKPLPNTKPPAQMSGSEGVPPLPLPAVPQRRTEKKNPPRPPVLVVKIVTNDELDWNTNPQDVENLLTWMAKNIGVNFSSQNRSLDSIFGVCGKKQMAVLE